MTFDWQVFCCHELLHGLKFTQLPMKGKCFSFQRCTFGPSTQGQQQPKFPCHWKLWKLISACSLEIQCIYIVPFNNVQTLKIFIWSPKMMTALFTAVSHNTIVVTTNKVWKPLRLKYANHSQQTHVTFLSWLKQSSVSNRRLPSETAANVYICKPFMIEQSSSYWKAQFKVGSFLSSHCYMCYMY